MRRAPFESYPRVLELADFEHKARRASRPAFATDRDSRRLDQIGWHAAQPKRQRDGRGIAVERRHTRDPGVAL